MLAYVRPICVYEFSKGKIKPSYINTWCNGFPLPSYRRLGRLIVICEKPAENTEFPIHTGAKY